ncbi:hypothetical protein [Deinococcus peraridilitoris]|uniref:Uncharacterized protein n=1 Tax=Deinococcus peraridilitoris (strain DSM 19664 / LMG 22246 / CIP 109416 / KR-200) TaxID=937777 RepID=K9ZYX2_DEIPD|nr:hypothetical protein [Deinococcus peraridilitoris]AFZ66791.1 hypothetical protein Deipe_1241 [Deinococcus peraridilitoris DSM 19664]
MWISHGSSVHPEHERTARFDLDSPYCDQILLPFFVNAAFSCPNRLAGGKTVSRVTKVNSIVARLARV